MSCTVIRTATVTAHKYTAAAEPYVKILHVGDASGVTMVLAKWQARTPGDDVAVTVPKYYLPFTIVPYYMGRRGAWHRMSLQGMLNLNVPKQGGPFWRRALNSAARRFDDMHALMRDGSSRHITRARTYVDLAARQARGCDVVHVHVAWEWLEHLRNALPRRTSLIIHHHGDHLRLSDKADVEAAEAHADLALVSTPDLLAHGEHRTYLPNPVDTDMFSPAAGGPRPAAGAAPRAFYLIKEWEVGKPDAEKARFIDKHCPHGATGIDYVIDYRDMPEFLRGYDLCLDMKRNLAGTIETSLNMLGLQSLAMGLDVITYDGTVHDRLPARHKPEAVAAQARRLYEQVRGRG